MWLPPKVLTFWATLLPGTVTSTGSQDSIFQRATGGRSFRRRHGRFHEVLFPLITSQSRQEGMGGDAHTFDVSPARIEDCGVHDKNANAFSLIFFFLAGILKLICPPAEAVRGHIQFPCLFKKN